MKCSQVIGMVLALGLTVLGTSACMFDDGESYGPLPYETNGEWKEDSNPSDRPTPAPIRIPTKEETKKTVAQEDVRKAINKFYDSVEVSSQDVVFDQSYDAANTAPDNERIWRLSKLPGMEYFDTSTSERISQSASYLSMLGYNIDMLRGGKNFTVVNIDVPAQAIQLADNRATVDTSQATTTVSGKPTSAKIVSGILKMEKDSKGIWRIVLP